MTDLDSHMLREVYRSVCDPENPDSLGKAVRELAHRVNALEVKFNVAAAFFTAIGGIVAAALGALRRLGEG